jgi:hypothetical protein
MNDSDELTKRPRSKTSDSLIFPVEISLRKKNYVFSLQFQDSSSFSFIFYRLIRENSWFDNHEYGLLKMEI